MSLICCFVCLSKAVCLASLTFSASSPPAVRFLVAIALLRLSWASAPICSAILFTAVRGSGGRPIVRASSADSCAMRSDRSTAALAGVGSFGGKAASLSPAVAGSSKREPAGRKAPPALPESLRAAAVRAARSVASASLSPPSMSLRLYSCSLNSFCI